MVSIPTEPIGSIPRLLELPSLAGLRVLVVDDQEFTRALVAAISAAPAPKWQRRAPSAKACRSSSPSPLSKTEPSLAIVSDSDGVTSCRR
jgi:hypothetical protein